MRELHSTPASNLVETRAESDTSWLDDFLITRCSRRTSRRERVRTRGDAQSWEISWTPCMNTGKKQGLSTQRSSCSMHHNTAPTAKIPTETGTRTIFAAIAMQGFVKHGSGSSSSTAAPVGRPRARYQIEYCNAGSAVFILSSMSTDGPGPSVMIGGSATTNLLRHFFSHRGGHVHYRAVSKSLRSRALRSLQ
jgi:hypothetical protein